MFSDNNHLTEDFIKISVLENAIEAQIFDSILNDLNIPHRIRSYHDTALNGLYQAQKGWGIIEAPMSYQKELVEIIDKVKSCTHFSDNELTL